MSTTRARRRVAILLTAALVVTLAACSKGKGGSEGSDGTKGSRAIDASDATRLASTLYDNHQAGGATFEVNASFPDGTTLRMLGAMDWTGGFGRAFVESDAKGSPTSVVWGNDWILETTDEAFPENAEDAASAEPSTTSRWTARTPQPSERNLDSVLRLVTNLAKNRRDNPQLLQQDKSLRWLRTGDLRNQKVDVFQVSTNNRYWLAAGTSTMLRFEAFSQTGDRQIVIDLLDLGKRKIPSPSPRQVTGGTWLGPEQGLEPATTTTAAKATTTTTAGG